MKRTSKPDYLEGHYEIVGKARSANRALNFLRTVAANLDNEAINDKEFREFMRRSMTGMPGIEYPKN